MNGFMRRAGALWLRLFAALLAFLLLSPALAADRNVLVIVSDRSAPTVVAGAHQLLDAIPGERIQVRTLSQLTRMGDTELQSLVSEHRALLLLAVFGEPVERLLALRYPDDQFRTVLHSDRRLLPLQRDRDGDIFATEQPKDILDEKLALFSPAALAAVQSRHPRYAHWLQSRAYWINRSAGNTANLLNLIASSGARQAPLQSVPPVRFALHAADGTHWLDEAQLLSRASTTERTLWILDHDTGDLAGEWSLHERLCAAGRWQCISVLATWGEPSVAAIRAMTEFKAATRAAMAVVAVQDFVIGGGEHREDVTALLTALDVPVLKALRQRELTEAEWRLSHEGVPAEKVHYRLAMPELQGISQPQVLAVSEPERLDARTGARVALSHSVDDEIDRQARRLDRWMTLQTKANADKRVAIVYYNHPPGRHNIGADNLNVPDSLLEMLRALKAAGYTTGKLPADSAALLDRLQAEGVNLPEDADALAGMAPRVASLDTGAYRAWFDTLPATVRAGMTDGPVAELRILMQAQAGQIVAMDTADERAGRIELLRRRMHGTAADLHHALDGARHKSRARALDLLGQLEASYDQALDTLSARQMPDWGASDALATALIGLRIEGIRGWGAAPGKVMVWQGRQLIPGIRFGNIFLGPQPPRGWELNEELLHANMSFPPPHQYFGFYHYLQSVFKADALVHVGRHSTYEFLPKRNAGLSQDDYPSLIAGDLPGIYPYIVDGVGEGIQAKRRGLAVMVDHLTPPLSITALYDDLLEIRQLIESAEATTDAPVRRKAVLALRDKIDQAGLREEIVASMDEELKVRGVRFEDADDEMLLHEVGHYLTKLQEDFMPLGLHVFGRDWTPEGIDTMLASMADGADTDGASHAQWRQNLTASPAAEMSALLAGLDGRFVPPGKGNDPIRTPEALPTGRNFFALDGSLMPTKLAWETGAALADQVLTGQAGVAAHTEAVGANKQGIILWASDAVRDEGTMIAFGLRLLGVKPVWNSRGIVKGLERLPLDSTQTRRFDVVFTTSGLFRDLYGQHMLILDKASLAALDASRATIERDYPALSLALLEALKPLGEWQRGGDEPLAQNQVAANWVDQARKMMQAQPDMSPAQLGRQASARVFGIAPGAYGAGINRMVERSGSWQDRSELAEVFTRRMGHAYGAGLDGVPAQALFETQLQGISQTFLGRASNLYGLMDNNDAFDYLGGFNMAVEHQRGTAPASAVINHANARDTRIDPLHSALLGELRGRFLNPQWIKPLMDEGYAGARTMGNEFIEYLWGWQVTSPAIIDDRVWAEVKAVYVDDKHGLGLDRFLAEGHNRYVQTNILAVMLVAIDKGFWAADEATRTQLAEQFATNIIEHGNPGSGHTHANHPMYDMVKARIGPDRAAQLEAVLASNRMDVTPEATDAPDHVQEVRLEATGATASPATPTDADTTASDPANADANAPDYLPWFAIATALLILVGAARGRLTR